jgi:dTDP-glucose 4,6-dehydratase
VITFIDAATDDPQRRCPDISLARTALKWQPEISLADGLKHTVEWFERRLSSDPR